MSLSLPLEIRRNIKAKDLWTITLQAAVKRGAHIALHLEKHVRKGGTKIRAVTGVEAGTARVVNVLTMGTVKFHRVVTRGIAQADRQQSAPVAEMTRTGTKGNLSIFFQLASLSVRALAPQEQWVGYHLGNASVGKNKSGVDKTVQVSRGSVNRPSAFFRNTGIFSKMVSYLYRIAEEKESTELVLYQVKGLREMLYFHIQTGQIEPVNNILFVDIAKELVALEAQEPSHPQTRRGRL